MSAPIKQVDSKFILESFDLLTERGLNDIHAPCGTTKMQSFCRRNDVADLSQIRSVWFDLRSSKGRVAFGQNCASDFR
jgi:hypothetical protein